MQMIATLSPSMEIYDRSSICAIENRYNVINPFLNSSKSIVIQALKIEACRHENMKASISLILENMGYKEMKAKTLSQILYPFISGKTDLPPISQTSSLGRFLKEFEHRRKAFVIIHRYLSDVSEIVLKDVAFPLERELRKEVDREIHALLSTHEISRGKLESEHMTRDECQEDKSLSILHEAQKGFYFLGNQLTSFLTYANTRWFSFPTASAESQIMDIDSCENDLLSEKCKWNLDEIKKMQKKTEVETDKAKDKNCIRVLGYTGAGKSTWINYLFSDKCAKIEDNWKCKPEIALTGSSSEAVTKHIGVYLPQSRQQDFIENTVFVDFPGLFGAEKNAFTHFVQSILAVKSIIRIGKVANTVIDVILIEASTIEKKGALRDLTTALSLNKEIANRLLIITKTPIADQTESRTWNRARIVSRLIETGIDRTLANNLILYNLRDKDYALNSSTFSGGGSNRETLIQTIVNLQNGAMTSRSNSNGEQLDEIITDSLNTGMINERFLKIEKSLKIALENPNGKRAKEIFKQIKILMELDYDPLNRMVSSLFSDVNSVSIENESERLFKQMLQSGNTTSFLDHFKSKIIPLRHNNLNIQILNDNNLINGYVRSLLEISQSPQSFKHLSQLNVFNMISRELSKFLPILKNTIIEQLKSVEKKIDDASQKCGVFTNKESDELKVFVNFLIKAIADGDDFKEIIKLIERINKNHERLKKINESFKKEEFNQQEEKLRFIRNRILGSLFALWVLRYISLNIFSRTRQEIIQEREKQKEILTGRFGETLMLYFTESDITIENDLHQYNQWEKSADGEFLESKNELKLKAKGDVIQKEGNKYCLLQPVDLNKQIRATEELCNIQIQKIGEKYAERERRMEERFNNANRINLITSLLPAITTGVISFIFNHTFYQNALAAFSFKYGLNAIDNFLMDCIRRPELLDWIHHQYGEEIIKQACARAQEIANA